LARTDPLTGAANARTFYETTAVEAGRARRAGRPLTLAYLDLDNFNQLNDGLGHAAGDQALVHLVAVIRLHLRASDLLARLGGDEFALLLPEAGTDGAVALLARLQEKLAVEMAARGWPVSVSIGVVSYLRPPADVDRMIQRADALMYRAKRRGKGRVEHALVQGDEPGEGGRGPERRATARILCDRSARVRPGGQDEHEEFAILRDISAEGVGLSLQQRLAPDTILVVEPLSNGARTLLARVVRVSPGEGGWLHGCVLSLRLSPDEIAQWLGSVAGPDESDVVLDARSIHSQQAGHGRAEAEHDTLKS
jgi:diguanylate cyclase (GGDEF)-like protein